jgi:hypothetical protein
MRTYKELVTFIITMALSLVIGSAQSVQIGTSEKDKNYESTYASLSAKVDKEQIRNWLYYLSKDPLPRRVMNWSLPGHTLSSLEEADAWIMQQLTSWGYTPYTDETKVRAYGRDFSKPPALQYASPAEAGPWYTAHNVIAGKQGTEYPDELIVLIAHKDSQSWIDSPGANDNGTGTIGVMELARVLSTYQPKHTLRFIFCNEEHSPWTSITAAEAIKAAGLKVLAAINLDGIGVKPPSYAGHLTNVTRYTTIEGKKLADLMASLNKRHALGLEQTMYRSDQPSDDDGSFINAGFAWSVLNIGSWPYGDANYHIEGDTPEKVDYENAKVTVQLTLAAILYLDTYGRP